MIKFENSNIYNLENAIRGMRNPLNSWNRSDSITKNGEFKLGANDLDLATRLKNAGPEHRKYLRQIFVSVDIDAPLYWWKQFDTYKIGTTSNSCSTMHTISKKPLELDNFSFEGLNDIGIKMDGYVKFLNVLIERFNATGDKKFWEALIKCLPESLNQKRTVTMNYEVLSNMYQQRKNHKLKEWHAMCDWIKTLPYANELIIGQENQKELQQ